VVAEKRSKLEGPPVEDVGTYNPFTKQVIVRKERVTHWLQVGAKPTVTVHNLFVTEGIISGPKIAIPIRARKEAEGSPKETAAEMKEAEAKEDTRQAP